MERTIDPSDPRILFSADGPGAADVRAQLERILASTALRVSPRRRDLLRFLVEETLAGRSDRLKGYTVALAVFGRDETFDASSDPVVRFEARRLRRDLDSYYVDAGSRDPLRITIPKGGYIPHFEWQGPPAALPQPPSVRSLADAPVAEAAAPTGAIDPGTDAAAATDAPVGAPDRAHGRLGRRWWAALAVFALLIAAAGGAWLWRYAGSPPAEAARGPAVIVLPFETLSANAEDGFLAAGLSHDLITDLMRFEGFRLFSVPASFSQDGSADPVTLGQDLGVGDVVKGGVSSDATTVRVGAQLYNAQTGSVVWSQSYDRAPTPGALLEVRAELAASVATALGQAYGVLNSDMAARLAGDAEPSMASYACVLRAHTYRRTFRDDLRQPVLACLEAATLRDPDYVEPWAMLGWLHLDAARYAFVPDSDAPAELGKALAMASRAVAIDPQNVVALQALSAVQFHLGNFAESERTQRKALALNPNDPDTMAQLGWRLAVRGRWDEGIPYLERAIARTINPPGWYYDLIAIHLYIEGRYDEMLAAAEHSAAGDATGVSFLAIAHGALGNQVEAEAALARMAEQAPVFARDPAAVFRRFQPLDGILDAIMDGLRNAGWKDPSGAPTL